VAEAQLPPRPLAVGHGGEPVRSPSAHHVAPLTLPSC